jgi:tRNA pseudouridine55 synthase
MRRIGHAGTLDPFATGLLIVGVGTGTKQLTALVGTDKTYVATARLGATSTTDDPEGTITELVGAPLAGTLDGMSTGRAGTRPVPTKYEIESCLKSFVGTYEQTAPIFSAKKVGGKKLYDLARKGLAHTVEIPKKMVTISELRATSYEWPFLSFEVTCSSGTYIRALARDLGAKLGCGAYLTALRRTRVGEYRIEDARTIQSVVSSQ